MTAQYLLAIFAGICLLVAALGVGTGRVNALALGMFFWLAADHL